jgi:hypothetical protein
MSGSPKRIRFSHGGNHRQHILVVGQGGRLLQKASGFRQRSGGLREKGVRMIF